MGEASLVDAYVSGLSVGGMTSMGGATATALDELASSTRKHIILFSDGMQNYNPMLADTPTDQIQILEVDTADVGDHDLVSWVYGDTGVAGKPRQDLSSFGTHIHTIGVGVPSSPWTELMDQVAVQTDGTQFQTPAPELDLQSFYITDLLESFKGATPQLLRHRHHSFSPKNCPLTDSCWLSSTVKRLTIALTWQGDPDRNQLCCALEAPDGTLLDLHERTMASPRRRIITIPLPVYHRGRLLNPAGKRHLHVTGRVRQEIPCQVFWIADDHRVHLHFGWRKRLYRVGDSLKINVQLTQDDKPLPTSAIRKTALTVDAPAVNHQRFFNEYRVSAAKLRSARKKMKWPGPYTDSAVKLFVLNHDKEAVAKVTRTIGKRVRLESTRDALSGAFTFTKPGIHRFTMNVESDDRQDGRVVRTTTGSVYVRPRSRKR